MIYASTQYAEALYEALADKKEADQKKVLAQFVTVLEKNHQTKLLPQILKKYEHLFLKKQNIRKVDVQSVDPLSAKIKKQIETLLGNKILLTETIRPELVAGMTILVDDSMYIDASARSQINNLFA